MLDLLYTLFIQPLEFWMSKALMWGYDQTHSWGLAIIVMSLVVNIVILPIYLKAESWQEEERSIRKRIENDEKMIKETFKGQERFAMISTLYRQAGFSPLMTLRSSVGFFLQIPFFFAAYHFLSHFDPFQGVSFWGLNNLAKPDEMLSIAGISINVMPILMTVINLASALIYTQNLSRKDKIQLYGMAGIFLVLLYDAASGLVLYWTCNNIFSFAKNIIISDNICSSFSNKLNKFIGVFTQSKTAPITTKFTKSNDKLNNTVQGLFWPSCIFWLSLAFLFFPIKLYVSDPLVFSKSFDFVFSSLIATIQLSIFVVFIIWLIFKPYRGLLAILGLFIAIASVVFAFIVEPDYGVIDGFTLQKTEALYNEKNKLIDLAVAVSTIALISIFLKFHLVKILKIAFVTGTVAIWSICIIDATNFEHPTPTPTMTKNDSKIEIPPEVKETFVFDENGKNIIVVMLDMFTGDNLEDILIKNPHLKNDLDGFVWYKDSISSGSSTIYGKPAILGGADVAAYNLLKPQSQSLEVTINRSWLNFFKKLDKANFQISLFDNTWLNPELLQNKLSRPLNLIFGNTLWDQLPKIWEKNNNFQKAKKSVKEEKFLIWYGVFKVFPLSKRRIIYRHGKWKNSIDNATFSQEWALSWLSQLDSYSELSSLNNTGINQFKFLINELTHVPWSLDESCRPNLGSHRSSEKTRKTDGTWDAHIQTEYCAMKSLAKWFTWMKSNNVYNNTMIIITSDHGRGDSRSLYKANGYKPYPFQPHSLLLVKPFNKIGALKINRDYITANWDIPNLILESTRTEKSELEIWKDPNRIRCNVSGAWQREKHAKTYFSAADQKICVEGSLFRKENWHIEKIGK